jgi:hypothetical protein
LNFTDIVQGASTDGVNTLFAGMGYDLVTGVGSPNCSTLETTLVGSTVPYAAASLTWTADYYPAYSSVSAEPEFAQIASGTGTVSGGTQLVLSLVENTTPQWQPETGTDVAGPVITFTGGTDPNLGLAIADIQLGVSPSGAITGFGDFSAVTPISGTAVLPTNDPDLEFTGQESTVGGVTHGTISFYTIDSLGNKVGAGPFQTHAADVLTGTITF